MYINYVSTSTWTMSQVISDIGLIVSGSELSALSASCNQSLSSKTGTAPADWQIHDAAAGVLTAGGVVVKAQDRDSLTTKYCRILGMSATQILGYVHDAWNASTHAGTNTSTSVSLNLPAGNAFTLNIFVTKEYISIIYEQNASNASSSIIFGEILRDTPFIDKLQTPVQPVHFVTSIYALANAVPHIYGTVLRNPSTGATVTAPGYRSMTLAARVQATTTEYAVAAAKQYLRPDGTTFYPVAPIFIGWLDGTNLIFYGRLADNGGHSFLYCAINLPAAANGDIMVINGMNYKYYPNHGILVPVK